MTGKVKVETVKTERGSVIKASSLAHLFDIQKNRIAHTRHGTSYNFLPIPSDMEESFLSVCVRLDKLFLNYGFKWLHSGNSKVDKKTFLGIFLHEETGYKVRVAFISSLWFADTWVDERVFMSYGSPAPNPNEEVAVRFDDIYSISEDDLDKKVSDFSERMKEMYILDECGIERLLKIMDK